MVLIFSQDVARPSVRYVPWSRSFRRGRPNASASGLTSPQRRRSVVLDRPASEQKVLGQAARWRALLGTHVHEARQLLREVLQEPLVFHPDGRAYRFTGVAASERLLGEVGLPPCGTSPTGSFGLCDTPAIPIDIWFPRAS